jgi:hypothetical protein
LTVFPYTQPMETIRTWLVSDIAGRNIFYFELLKINATDDTLCFDSNISFQLKHKVIVDYIELLISNHLPDSTKDSIATQLFNLIKKIKCYQKFYFDESVLDKNGKLNMSNYKLIQELTFAKLKQEDEYNVPISNYSFPDLFRVFENYFCIHKHDIMKHSKIITKVKFEGQLTNDTLKHEYVTIYNKSNLYFLHESNQIYHTYFILRNQKLQLAFKVNKYP